MKTFKKTVAFVLALSLMLLAFAGCGSSGKKTVGIIQFGSHASLNNCYDGIMKGLTEGGIDADKYDFVRSEKWLFEILPKGVHKGLALSKLVEHLGVDPKRTVGIGDYNNDIGLFKSAAVGIAVSNACQEALDAADFITVSNEEHAIAQVIYDIENNKYPL